MTQASVLKSLYEQAQRDPLLEMFLLTAIDEYAESLADLDEETLRRHMLENSPKKSRSGINAAGWKERALKIRQMLREAYENGSAP